MNVFLQVLRYLRPYRRGFLLAIGQVVLLSLLEILKPWPLKVVIDYVLPRRVPPWPALQGLSPLALLALATAALMMRFQAGTRVFCKV